MQHTSHVTRHTLLQLVLVGFFGFCQSNTFQVCWFQCRRQVQAPGDVLEPRRPHAYAPAASLLVYGYTLETAARRTRGGGGLQGAMTRESFHTGLIDTIPFKQSLPLRFFEIADGLLGEGGSHVQKRPVYSSFITEIGRAHV